MKDTSAQTSEIITYEADVQTVHKQDAGVLKLTQFVIFLLF